MTKLPKFLTAILLGTSFVSPVAAASAAVSTPASTAEDTSIRPFQFHASNDALHFAAWEQPALLTQDLRDTFRSVRRANGGRSAKAK